MKQAWQWELDDLKRLIGLAESMSLEFKRSKLLDQGRDTFINEITETISAFANSTGGIIVIGINDEKEGKTRIAKSIDEGISRAKWGIEQLQQMVESNVAPHLIGMRFRPIPFASEAFGLVIHVPQGTTAYQASDKRYYGRSEFENRALPDHEIRLRMNRGRVPQGTLEFFAALPRGTGVQQGGHCLAEVVLTVYFKNIGEINVSELKTCMEIGKEKRKTVWSLKDGWPDPWNESTPTMRINVYPEDIQLVCRESISVHLDHKWVAGEMPVKWQLFLPNCLPMSGSFDLADHFIRHASERADVEWKVLQQAESPAPTELST